MLQPTRGKNVLDIVLSSQKKFVDNVKICEPLECSDIFYHQSKERTEEKNKEQEIFSQRKI